MESKLFLALVRAIAVIFILLGGGFGSSLTWNYFQSEKETREAGLEYAHTQTDLVAKHIDEEMSAQKQLAIDLARQLETTSLDETSIKELLKDTFEQKSDLYGIGLGIVPHSVPGLDRYAIFYHWLDSGQCGFTQVDGLYDYTSSEAPTAIWYVQTVLEKQGQWYSYYGKASDDWIIVYAEPFYQVHPVTGERILSGVVSTVHSVNSTFHQLFQYIPLGREGYAVLSDHTGKIVYHPKREYISLPMSQIADQMGDATLRSAAQRLPSEEGFEVERVAANGFITWTIFRQLPSSGWHVIAVVRQDVLARPVIQRVRELINIGLCVMVMLIGLAILIFQPEKARSFGTWGFSVSLGLICLSGIIWIWYLMYSSPIENGSVRAIVNEQNISDRLARFETSDQARTRGIPQRIPTGVVIQSISVTSQTAVVAGYIWQKFPVDFEEERIQPPQFTNQITKNPMREAYRFIRNGKIVVGWFFNAELSEVFNISRYPLDEMTVKVEIEPANLADNIIFVPDIAGYEYMSPSIQPGLSDSVLVPGWNLRTSYFTFETQNYNADFGGAIDVYKNEYPLLVYNVHGIRNIISPLIAYCIVIYVLLVQIFGVVMIEIKEPLEVLSVGAALFLVNAISHNALRGELAATRTLYLEYFFILLYVTILASSVNGLARSLKLNLAVLKYRDNILAKVLFWPLYLGIGFVITIQIFYP